MGCEYGYLAISIPTPWAFYQNLMLDALLLLVVTICIVESTVPVGCSSK